MRRTRNTSVLLAITLAASSLALPPASTGADSAPARPHDANPARGEDDWRDDAAASSHDVAVAADAPSEGRIDRRLLRLESSTADVAVEITGTDSQVRDAVAKAGGTLGRGGGGLWLATVPGARLRTLSMATGVTSVREPVQVNPILSERNAEELRADRGVYDLAATDNVRYWHRAGYTATGVKIGIIGLFDMTVWQTEVSNGELSAIAPQNTICVSAGVTCPFGTPGRTWGNSLAEIVADAAPSADLYLAELGTRTDYYAVIDWMAANGVTILLNPLVWTYDGPGDGTGPSGAIVDYAVSKGIAWFNSAGELGGYHSGAYYGSYWQGRWADPDNDRWLNFAGSDESLSAYCGFLLGLRWSDWGALRTDYDLYISDFNIATRGNGTRKVLSAAVQGPGVAPLEGVNGVALCNTNPANGPVYDTNKDGFVSLWVQRKSTSTSSSATNDLLQIGLAYGWLEHWVQEGSGNLAFADSANPGAVTVGSKDYFYNQGLPRGGTGPTSDGRRKPDVMYNQCNSTSLDGVGNEYSCEWGYYGTDGSAAFVAGVAAVTKQAMGIPTPTAIAAYLEDNSIDPETGLDPQVDGGGKVNIGPNPPPKSYPNGELVLWPTLERLVDTRKGLGAPQKLRAGQTLHLYVPNKAGDWPFAQVLNIVLVNPTADGWLEAYPHGWSYPRRSSVLNADAGKTTANLVVVPSNQNRIDIYSSGGGDIVVDWVGGFKYATPEGTNSAFGGGGRFRALEPFRLADSRSCTGLEQCSGQPMAAKSFTDISFWGASDSANPSNLIPANASAVAFSLTVDSPLAKGWASVVPGGTTTVATSNLNFEASRSITNLVISRLDANGVARLYLSQGAHFQIDVLGWFTPADDAPSSEGTFVPVTPTRAVDTRRPPAEKPGAGVTVTVDLGSVGVPVSAPAAWVNNISVLSTAAGEFNVAPTPPVDPTATRNLTFSNVGRPVAAATLSKLSDGELVVRTSASSHVITDAAGYFLPASAPPAPEGSVQLISHAPDGAPANAPAFLRLMSRTGQAALFASTATNLDPTPTGSGLFLWRAADDSVIELPTDGSDVALSADGNTFAFNTSRPLLPEDISSNNNSVYVYHAETDTLDFIPTPYTISYNAGVQITDDGRFVWYSTDYGPNGPHLFRYDTTTQTLSEPLGNNAPDVIVLADGSGYISLTAPNCSTATLVTFSPASSTPLKWSTCTPSDVSTDGTWVAQRSYMATRTNSFTGEATYFQGCYGQLETSMAITDDGQTSLLKAPQCRLGLLDWSTGVLTPVDRTYDARVPTVPTSHGDMSADGQFVVFSTLATNILETPAPFGGVYRVDTTLL